MIKIIKEIKEVLEYRAAKKNWLERTSIPPKAFKVSSAKDNQK